MADTVCHAVAALLFCPSDPSLRPTVTDTNRKLQMGERVLQSAKIKPEIPPVKEIMMDRLSQFATACRQRHESVATAVCTWVRSWRGEVKGR